VREKDFYTSAEAIQRFITAGISESTFYRKVREGAIQKVLPEGRQRGAYYPKSVIEEIISREGSNRTEENITEENIGETDWVQSSDLPYLLALDYEMYGPENTVDVSITRTWWEKNPYMCRILFDAKNRKNIWGAITILPMKEETIFHILKQEREERYITAEDILTYEPGNKYVGYIPSAAIRPEHRTHFRQLLQSVFNFWCEQYPDIQLLKLYAFALSDEGWDLMKHLFFSPRYDLGANTFELSPNQRNPSRLITSFQKCVKQKEEGRRATHTASLKTATFGISTAEDVPGIYEVIASLWGALSTTPVHTRLGWYQSNPDIDFVVKQEGTVIGYVTIMPLKHETLEKLMTGEIRGWDITPADILPFTPGIPLECFVGIAVKAGVPHPRKYGMRLIAGAIKILKEFAQKGVLIQKLCAVSDTPDGTRLSRELGFIESPPAPNSTFIKYTLDLETSDSPYAREYQQILQQSTKQAIVKK
jgi:hypothetical protein